MVTILNIITLFILITIIVLLTIRWFKHRDNSTFILIIAFVFLFVATTFNLPEHLRQSSKYDLLEVLFNVLFLPTLILAISIVSLNKELGMRKVSEQKFRAIFNNAYSLIGLLDKDGLLKEANEKALNMVNVKLEEVFDVPFTQTKWWIHSPEEQLKLKNALIEAINGNVARLETYHIDATGKKRYIDFSVTPIFSLSGKTIQLIVEGRDITEIKDIQQRLEYHKDHLEDLVKIKTKALEETNDHLQAINSELNTKNEIINKQNEELKSTIENLKETQMSLIQAEKMASLGILTAGVAHEINNPLNYIMGSYDGLKLYFEKYGTKDEQTTSLCLESIHSGVQRATKIVSGLNQFSRDNTSFDEDCHIHVIIDNCLAILNNQLNHKVKIVKDFASGDLLIKGNVGKLHQVFINIITNSIQAIDKDGEIIVQTENHKDEVRVKITDNGHGISKEDISYVTDPFFTTKEPGKGTGLGLSITYSIVKDHGGFMEINSEINVGTTIVMIFPILQKNS